MKLTIELPEGIDQEGTATVLEAIAQCLRHDETLEDRELMDDSIRFETPHGPAFVTFELETED